MSPSARPSVVAVVCLLLTAGLVMGVRHSRLHAESMPTAPDPGAAAPGAPTEPVDYFQPFPAGHGAIPFEELLDYEPAPPTEAELAGQVSPERAKELATDTKESILKIADWAAESHGEDVHATYSGYTAQMQEHAALKKAEFAAGAGGLGEAGLP